MTKVDTGRRTPVLGLSERWSLSRNNIDSPITVIYYASVTRDLVSISELQDVAAELVDIYPILRCGVADKDTSRPFYETNPAIQPRSLVKLVEHRTKQPSAMEVTHAAVRTGKSFDVTNGPMWEVQLHQAPMGPDRLVLVIDHILCDGVGAKNLFADLLNLISGGSVIAQPGGLPSRMDDNVDLTSGVLIPPQVTSPNPPKDYADFPPTPAKGYNSVEAPTDFTDFSIPAADLKALLAAGKGHLVSTVHPVLHVASLMALYRASNSGSNGLKMTTSVPISERNEAKGDPRSTGNYVTFHYSTDIIHTETSFWEYARLLSGVLKDPAAKLGARQALGKLSTVDETEPEGWNGYMRKLAADPKGPHKLSLAVSNVGLVDLPQSGKLAGQVGDVYFQQSASAIGGCAVISIVSTRGGPLTVSFCSKLGSFPKGTLDRLTAELEIILLAIARGDIDEDSTVGDALST